MREVRVAEDGKREGRKEDKEELRFEDVVSDEDSHIEIIVEVEARII
jgi:hypothetical protein